MDILLKGSKYRSFKLKIGLHDQKQIRCFNEFINKVKFPKSLEFESIVIPLKGKYPKPHIPNSVYNTLKERGVDYQAIKIVFLDSKATEAKGYKGALEYTKELSFRNEFQLNYFKRIRKIDHDSFMINIETLLKTKVSIQEIHISCEILSELYQNFDNLKISEEMSNSLTTLVLK